MSSTSHEQIPIEPSVIKWARSSAGYGDIDTAAQKIRVSAATLMAWEAGEKSPTIKQLRMMAKAYRRPLAVLLLTEAPADYQPIADFRLISVGQRQPWSPQLVAEYGRALSQREVYLDLHDVAPTTVPSSRLQWTIRAEQSINDASAHARQLLHMDAWSARVWSDPNALLNRAISAVEDLGILIIHTRDVDIEEARGFSISDRPYPLIALNGSDWPRPRMFTLLHELAHIGYNEAGVCDLHENRRRNAQPTPEHTCNAFAAAVLMPEPNFLKDSRVKAIKDDQDCTLERLREVSQVYGSSSESTLLRLVDLGRVSWDRYWELKVELDDVYTKARSEQKIRRREREGGPSYYVVKARDLGHRYIGNVLTAFDSRVISSSEVTHYLGVRYEQIPKLAQVIRR